MAFHRYTAPGSDYVVPSGPGPLPTGYDYINNDPAAATGTAAGQRAMVTTGPKASGFNSGTYFSAWLDDATSANANRAHAALAENCDALDDLLRRRMGATKIASIAVGAAATYFVIPAWVYCGSGVETGNDLVQVVTTDLATGVTSLVPVHEADGIGDLYIQAVSDIKDNGGVASVLGTGWILNPRVYITRSPLGARTYAVCYQGRDSLASLNAGFNAAPRKGLVDITLAKQLRDVIGEKTGTFETAPVSNIYRLAASGLNERYRRSSVAAPFSGFNTPGIGAIITRDGIAPTSQSQIARGVRGLAAAFPDPLNVAWKADLRDTGIVLPGDHMNTTAAPGSVGFATYAHRWGMFGQKEYAPATASFMALNAHDSVTWPVPFGGNLILTKIPPSTGATIAASGDGFIVTLTDAGTQFFNLSNSATAIACGKDLLEVVIGAVKRTFLIARLYSGVAPAPAADVTKAFCYAIDAGTLPDIVGTMVCNVTWLSPQFAVGHGAIASKREFHAMVDPYGDGLTLNENTGFDGLYAVQPPLNATGATVAAGDFWVTGALNRVAAYFGASTQFAAAVAWGGYDPVVGIAGYTRKGFLDGEGGVRSTRLRVQGVDNTYSVDATDGGVTAKRHRPFSTSTANITVATPNALVFQIDEFDVGYCEVQFVGAALVDSITLDVTSLTIPCGSVMKLIFNHKLGKAALNPAIYGHWTTSTGGVVTFATPADAELSNVIGAVDIFEITNVGTAAVPQLVGKVTRY